MAAASSAVFGGSVASSSRRDVGISRKPEAAVRLVVPAAGGKKAGAVHWRQATRCQAVEATSPETVAAGAATVAAGAAAVAAAVPVVKEKIKEVIEEKEEVPPVEELRKSIDPLKVVLFQSFNWESHKNDWYVILKNCVPDLAAAGITDVWLPPPSKSVASQGYMPTQLYNLDESAYGTEAELRELIDELHKHGLRAIADIVINHRCADFQDERGVWAVFEGGTEGPELDWGPWAIVKGDEYSDGSAKSHDTGEDYGAAPDIDHTNERVQQDLSDWMQWLKNDIGFDGWRFDFVKGYAGWAVGLYNDRTEPAFSVGELWGNCTYDDSGLAYNQDSHRQQLCNWIDETGASSTAFDFTTKGILQEAVNCQYWRLKDPNGKPSGLIGWYPSKAVTFIDNHDTGSTQAHWPFPGDKVMQGYAYILTHPGIPTVFYDHFFDWGLREELRKLLEVRRRNDIKADAAITIGPAEDDLYLAYIDDKLIVKLGPRYDLGDLTPDESVWQVAAAGADYCVWEKKK
eukprot:jgi/Chlat1/8592/Chrsp86S07992